MLQALDRNQAAIGDASGEARALRPEQRGTHRGMDAVCADQDVGLRLGAVGEAQLDTVAVIGEAGEAMPEVDAVLRQRARQRKEQVGAMEMVVGRAELGLDGLAERRALQGAAVVPAALMKGRRPHAAPCQGWAEAKQVQQARCVRADLDAGADRGCSRSRTGCGISWRGTTA